MHFKDSTLLNHYPKRSKKVHIYANPSPKVISENIIYDEVVETISETSKEYIDIATEKKVIEKLTEAGLLYHFTLFFGLEKNKQKTPEKTEKNLPFVNCFSIVIVVRDHLEKFNKLETFFFK